MGMIIPMNFALNLENTFLYFILLVISRLICY